MIRPSGIVRPVLCLAPAFVWTLGLFGVGAIPVGLSVPGSFGDKWLHAVAFGLYVPWLALAHRHLRPSRDWSSRFWYSAAASSAVGMLLEIWQLLWPSRTFEMLDWAADTVGALVVAGVFVAAYSVFMRRDAGGGPARVPPGA
jgi:VanZ family protein